MKKVLIIGGVSYDSIIYVSKFPGMEPQTVFSKGFHETVGSTGTGKALNISRLNFETTLHSTIGNDSNGEKVRKYFSQEKIKLIYDDDVKGTKAHTNLMDDNGDRISIFTSYGTLDPEIKMERIEKEIQETDYLVLNIINYVRNIIPIAKKYKKEIWCDIHDYNGKDEYYQDFIKGADYLFMSSNSMKQYRRFMKEMIQSGKKLVICTHGKKGATALTSEEKWIDASIIDDYKKIDTNGAGDSFFSGVLYGLNKGYSIEKSLKMGTIIAGLCVTSRELAYEGLSENLVESEYCKHYKMASV